MTETNLPTKALKLLEEANEELRAWAGSYARELLDALELPHDTINTAAVERIKQMKVLSHDMQALAPIVGVGSSFNAFAAAREYVKQVKEIARGLGVQDMNVAAEVRELRDKLHTSREERDRAELGRIDEMQRRGAAEARASEYQKALEEAHERLRQLENADSMRDALQKHYDAAQQKLVELQTELSKEREQAKHLSLGPGLKHDVQQLPAYYGLSDEELGQALGANCEGPAGVLCSLIHTASNRLQALGREKKELIANRNQAWDDKARVEKTLAEVRDQHRERELSWSTQWSRVCRALGWEAGGVDQVAQAVENTCLRLKMKEQDFTKCWADVCTTLGLPANETRDNVVKAIGRMRVAEEGAREAALGALDEVAELREQTGCSNCGEEFGKCVCPDDEEPKHCGDNVFYPNHARVGHCVLPEGHEGPHRENADLLEDLKVNVLDRMKYVLERIEDKRGDYYCGIESAASWVGDWIVGELPPFEAPKPGAYNPLYKFGPEPHEKTPTADGVTVAWQGNDTPALVFEERGDFGLLNRDAHVDMGRRIVDGRIVHDLQRIRFADDVDANRRFDVLIFKEGRIVRAKVQVLKRVSRGEWLHVGVTIPDEGS